MNSPNGHSRLRVRIAHAPGDDDLETTSPCAMYILCINMQISFTVVDDDDDVRDAALHAIDATFFNL